MKTVYCINVWPVEKHGRTKALVMITIGDAITVFPIRLVEGKKGMGLSFWGTRTLANGERTTFVILNHEERDWLTRVIADIYHPGKARFYKIQREERFTVSCKAFPIEGRSDWLVGKAEFTINKCFRVKGIRLLQFPNKRRLVYFPERDVRENGETVIKRIIDFKDNWEEIVTEKLWRAYDFAEKNRQRERG